VVNEVGVFFSFLSFIVGVSYLASASAWAAWLHRLAKEEYGGLALGLLLLPPGMIVLSFHNVWTWQPALFVTALGWSMALKGMFFLLFPQWYPKLLGKEKATVRKIVLAGSILALGGAAAGISYLC
jgi:hypothetical protein